MEIQTSITPGHSVVCCMVTLSPLHPEQQHFKGTESVYFDIENTPEVKCVKCHTPFHLQCGTWESVQIVRNKWLYVTSFVVESFRCSYVTMLLVLSFMSVDLVQETVLSE